MKYSSEQHKRDMDEMRRLGDIPANELQWTEEPVIGASLTLTYKMLQDSYGNQIEDNLYYWVAKHLPTGNLVIVGVVDMAIKKAMQESD